MRVFIVARYSPTDAGTSDIDVLADTLAEATRQAGHTPIVGWREIRARGYRSGREWMPFVKERLASCDLLLVAHHDALRGGLVEVGMAYAAGIPIWLAHRPGERVSNSVLGCADKIILYDTLDALRAALLQAFA